LTLFTADHKGFYLNNAPFDPLIEEGSTICLPARLSDDLDWSKEKKAAEQIVASGKYLFWELDLGLDAFLFTPGDSASFYAFSLAVEEFSKQIWPLFQEHTFGLSLYRGPFPPVQNFPLTHWESLFLEWTVEQGGDYPLYCVQMWVEYLHRLLSFLPETVLPFALIDATQIVSMAKAAQFFSTARFEHLHLAIKGANIPFSGISWEEVREAKSPCAPTLGVLLPSDECLSAPVLESLQGLLCDLTSKKMPFRIIPEEKLTEQWDGLDELFAISQALSAQGKRKLLGFIAAGGKVLSL
jgi:hypothetical protein